MRSEKSGQSIEAHAPRSQASAILPTCNSSSGSSSPSGIGSYFDASKGGICGSGAAPRMLHWHSSVITCTHWHHDVFLLTTFRQGWTMTLLQFDVRTTRFLEHGLHP